MYSRVHDGTAGLHQRLEGEQRILDARHGIHKLLHLMRNSRAKKGQKTTLASAEKAGSRTDKQQRLASIRNTVSMLSEPSSATVNAITSGTSMSFGSPHQSVAVDMTIPSLAAEDSTSATLPPPGEELLPTGTAQGEGQARKRSSQSKQRKRFFGRQELATATPSALRRAKASRPRQHPQTLRTTDASEGEIIDSEQPEVWCAGQRPVQLTLDTSIPSTKTCAARIALAEVRAPIEDRLVHKPTPVLPRMRLDGSKRARVVSELASQEEQGSGAADDYSTAMNKTRTNKFITVDKQGSFLSKPRRRMASYLENGFAPDIHLVLRHQQEEEEEKARKVREAEVEWSGQFDPGDMLKGNWQSLFETDGEDVSGDAVHKYWNAPLEGDALRDASPRFARREMFGGGFQAGEPMSPRQLGGIAVEEQQLASKPGMTEEELVRLKELRHLRFAVRQQASPKSSPVGAKAKREVLPSDALQPVSVSTSHRGQSPAISRPEPIPPLSAVALLGDISTFSNNNSLASLGSAGTSATAPLSSTPMALGRTEKQKSDNISESSAGALKQSTVATTVASADAPPPRKSGLPERKTLKRNAAGSTDGVQPTHEKSGRATSRAEAAVKGLNIYRPRSNWVLGAGGLSDFSSLGGKQSTDDDGALTANLNRHQAHKVRILPQLQVRDFAFGPPTPIPAPISPKSAILTAPPSPKDINDDVSSALITFVEGQDQSVTENKDTDELDDTIVPGDGRLEVDGGERDAGEYSTRVVHEGNGLVVQEPSVSFPDPFASSEIRHFGDAANAAYAGQKLRRRSVVAKEGLRSRKRSSADVHTPTSGQASPRNGREEKPTGRNRVALVIGLGSYDDSLIPDNSWCNADATAVANILTQLGFEVVRLGNVVPKVATKRRIQSECRRLTQKIAAPDDVGIVYFSGAFEMTGSSRRSNSATKSGRKKDRIYNTNEVLLLAKDTGARELVSFLDDPMASSQSTKSPTTEQSCVTPTSATKLPGLRLSDLSCDDKLTIVVDAYRMMNDASSSGMLYIGGRECSGHELLAAYGATQHRFGTPWIVQGLMGRAIKDQKVTMNSLNLFVSLRLKEVRCNHYTNAASVTLKDDFVIADSTETPEREDGDDDMRNVHGRVYVRLAPLSGLNPTSASFRRQVEIQFNRELSMLATNTSSSLGAAALASTTSSASPKSSRGGSSERKKRGYKFSRVKMQYSMPEPNFHLILGDQFATIVTARSVADLEADASNELRYLVENAARKAEGEEVADFASGVSKTLIPRDAISVRITCTHGCRSLAVTNVSSNENAELFLDGVFHLLQQRVMAQRTMDIKTKKQRRAAAADSGGWKGLNASTSLSLNSSVSGKKPPKSPRGGTVARSGTRGSIHAIMDIENEDSAALDEEENASIQRGIRNYRIPGRPKHPDVQKSGLHLSGIRVTALSRLVMCAFPCNKATAMMLEQTLRQSKYPELCQCISFEFVPLDTGELLDQDEAAIVAQRLFRGRRTRRVFSGLCEVTTAERRDRKIIMEEYKRGVLHLEKFVDFNYMGIINGIEGQFREDVELEQNIEWQQICRQMVTDWVKRENMVRQRIYVGEYLPLNNELVMLHLPHLKLQLREDAAWRSMKRYMKMLLLEARDRRAIEAEEANGRLDMRAKNSKGGFVWR